MISYEEDVGEIRLGEQVPNHSDDYLTFKSSFGQPITFQKENNYNLDYFHLILRLINVPPVLFVQLNSER